MAKRDNALFKKTTIDREAVNETTADFEAYDGLYDAPPDYRDFVKPLSVSEKKRRAELEGIISQNMKGFLLVSYALREIHQRELFRTTHQSFGEYCKDMWEMARQRAYQLIDAADVVDSVRMITGNLSTIVDNSEMCAVAHKPGMSPIGDNPGMSPIGDKNGWIPQNEAQARALVRFKEKPDALRTIVVEAVNTAEDGKITASHLKKTARRLHLEKVRDTIAKTRQRTNQAPKISDDFRKAFNAFLDQINIERANEYKNTDQDEVIKHVRIILEALETEL